MATRVDDALVVAGWGVSSDQVTVGLRVLAGCAVSFSQVAVEGGGGVEGGDARATR